MPNVITTLSAPFLKTHVPTPTLFFPSLLFLLIFFSLLFIHVYRRDKRERESPTVRARETDANVSLLSFSFISSHLLLPSLYTCIEEDDLEEEEEEEEERKKEEEEEEEEEENDE
jgi:hypothetical protein